MHERTRRQLCRLFFIALCAVPTLVTSSWAAYRASPFYAASQRAAWESLLLERTGLVSTIEQVERPAGGSVVLVGVELIDPDGGERIVRLRQIEIAAAPQGKVVLLSQPQIAQGKFLRLWDMLHERVMRGPPPSSAVQISTGELTVEIGRRAQTFTHVRCTVEPLESGVRALVDFQLAGIEMPSPAKLQIDRNRQMTPPTTSCQFHTDTFVPCDLFRDYLPAVSSLGQGCRFQGSVSALMSRDHWSGELSGRFSNIDLDQVTSSYPHRVTGSAELEVQRALFQQGKLYAANGRLFANGGAVSTSLLRSLAEQLGATVPTMVMRSMKPYAEYRQFAFQFELAPNGMKIIGLCPGTGNGIVMCATNEELLSIDPARQQSWIGLIRALSPSSDLLVPATEASKGLLGVLAIPESKPSANTIAQPPRARLQYR